MRYLFPVLLGVIGCAILVSLGVWQLHRLEWKQAMLAQVQARIDAAPQPLPATVTEAMKYDPVTVSGVTTGEEINLLSSTREQGGGYQIVSGFVTDDGRRIMVDRGYVPQQDRHKPRPPVPLQVVGNIHFPNEINSSTPAPNMAENIWFARDVPAMAAHLGTEPVLVVAAQVSGDGQGVQPLPVGISGIPNNHLEYAATWFMLAFVWLGMTIALIWRIRQRQY
ncbi:MAG: SURF1 family protein [Paracoccus sp. (in: a-proteobacteria)]|uniref:SURF1 family protein n=1 Tax=Paracoccus sp. TaxID=267 RepID=UPI0026E0E5DF|nr:SURF1 family protein [Paracoccus sp. (in: a-proteobacteria)]MDO5620070.1 SURF1 family protein [Paracoccus sp. (in: a-proteobacteria)]